MSGATVIGAAWRAVRDRFAAAGIDSPALDARLLAEKAFGLNGAALAAAENDMAQPEALARLDALAARRLTGEPVARILGEKEFFGLAFSLNADTLVPRPETELIVDLTLVAIEGVGRVLDLGTGSGCIAISIAFHAPGAEVTAIDLSAGALDAAKANAARHGVADRMQFLQGDWFQALDDDARFDVIVSNPPYIATDEMAGLMDEVRIFDPKLALDGGVDGLAPYRTICQGAAQRLQPGGWLMMEIGATQAEAVAEICAKAGLEDIAVHHDLAGLARVVVARL